jgi:hypothetical protein
MVTEAGPSRTTRLWSFGAHAAPPSGQIPSFFKSNLLFLTTGKPVFKIFTSKASNALLAQSVERETLSPHVLNNAITQNLKVVGSVSLL